MLLYPPNQAYFNNQIPTYGGNQFQQNNYQQPYQAYEQVPYNANMNIGGYGYYTGMYNNLYSPYHQRQLEEQRQQQERAAFEQKIQLEKALMRNSLAYRGIQIGDQELDEMIREQYYPSGDQQYSQEYSEIGNLMKNSMNLYNTQSIPYQDYEIYNQIQKANEIRDEYKNVETLDDWLVKVSQDLMRTRDEERRMQERDLRGLYDTNNYRSLLDVHNSTFSSLSGEVTLDDMSIELPSRLKNNYSERRRMFLEQIMNNNPGGNYGG
jgi:hypothetical protein